MPDPGGGLSGLPGPAGGHEGPRFGTDGIRGVANTDLTPELALAVGRAVARVLGPAHVVVGRDTRRSGPLLQAALSAGLAAEGVSVADVGVLPTPGVAYLSAIAGVPAAMISASHNPYADNGIKVFSAGGSKLPVAVEAAIEGELERILGGRPGGAEARAGAATGPGAGAGAGAGAAVGAMWCDVGAEEAYARHLVSTTAGRRLEGLKVVVDCANGAASAVGPRVLAETGAEVIVLAADPDGTNINDGCGSTHPQALQAAVVSTSAHVGLAFDGDADRCLAVDHTGQLVDGDHLLALFALDLRDRGELAGGSVAVTVMSNLGFRLSMEAEGICVVETPVGDRHVLEAMEAGGLVLGGEQSGHIILRRLATTGDGILTGLQLLDLLARRGRPLAELAGAAMVRLPQHLVSVPVAQAGLGRLPTAAAVWTEVAMVESELGAKGRVLLRPSGTEPLVRVMAEAPTADQAEAAVDRLCQVVRRELA